MPELPEVETIRQDLRQKILNTKIVQVVVFKPRSVGGNGTKFVQALKGNAFREIDRRGKLMVFKLKRGAESVLAHLKMTGQLIYERERKNRIEIVAGGHKLSASDIECLPNKHTRIVFVFANGGKLFFNDLRLFGYMRLAAPSAVEGTLAGFGIEPLTKGFTLKAFNAALGKRTTKIKAVLLDQTKIAGIGNIYADEICFCAKVMPMRAVKNLTMDERQSLYRCTSTTIRAAIKHRGTTFRNFLDSNGKKGNYTDFLNVYDRDGEKCKQCNTIIKKTRVAGRGTHFCGGCQK